MTRLNLSNEITRILVEMIESAGEAEIRRNDLAQSLGCVPSQINYVISSRFTPEHGYIVESRRGGGGYIKITRLSLDSPSAIMRTVNAVGDSADSFTCRSHILNLMSQNILSEECAKIMLAAVDDTALRCVPPVYRDGLRASIIKQMLLAYGKDD